MTNEVPWLVVEDCHESTYLQQTQLARGFTVRYLGSILPLVMGGTNKYVRPWVEYFRFEEMFDLQSEWIEKENPYIPL